jgi:hypothetical protein
MTQPENNIRKGIRLPRYASTLRTLLRNGRVIVSTVEAILNLKVTQKYGDATSVLPGKEAAVQIDDGFASVVLEATARPEDVGGDIAAMFPFKIYSPAANIIQIRGGLVGFRGNYLLPGTSIAGTRNYYQGNAELPLIAVGTDNPTGQIAYDYMHSGAAPDFFAAESLNTGGTVTVDGTTNPMLICSNQPGTSNPSNIQIELSNASAATEFSFWIKIVDDETDGPYTELWCGSVLPLFLTGAAARESITFALGSVTIDASGIVSIKQAQVGNLLNRYLELAPFSTNTNNLTNKQYAIPQVHRGWWNLNQLSGKMFYAGDIVVDDSDNKVQSGTGIGNFYWSYLYIGPMGSNPKEIMNIETQAPNLGFSGGTGKWTRYALIGK